MTSENKRISMSVTSLKGAGEESFPLLLQMLEEERPRSVCGCDSRHNSNRVGNGVAMVLGRWPGNITAGCVSAIFLTAVIFATVLMILSVLVIATLPNNIAHRMIIKRETALLEIDTSCDYREQEDKIIFHRPTKYSPDKSLFNLLGLERSFIIRRDFPNDTELQEADSFNAFFIAKDELLSLYQICSIESAAKSMPNYTLYLIMFTSNNVKGKQPSDKMIEDLATKYDNIKVYHLLGHRYFRDSPIADILEKSRFESSVIIFAARVLTLWRYGGIIFDMNLITVRNISSDLYPGPYDYNVMISGSKSSIMSVRSQCHAFLYEIMNSLASFYKGDNLNNNITVNDVMEDALNSFCHNFTIKFKSPRICKGVGAIPEYLICDKMSETMVRKKSCVWASINGSNLHLRQKLCPVAYHSHTSKREHKHTKIITHKRNGKSFS